MSLTVSAASTHTLREGAFGNATTLTCRACGAHSPLGPFYACMECFGPLEVGYDFGAVTREQIEAGPKNIWRYQPLLPVPQDVASFPNTEPGFTRLVNAGAARAGIRSVVFIPSDLERPKIITTAVYGGTLVAVDGNYDDVNKLASEIAGEEEGWAFVNVNVRPYYAEGSKTLAFEIAEQLGWRLPRQIVVPVASGSQLTKIDKGFAELVKLGLVEDTPYTVFGAQATGCSPVAQAFRDGHDVVKPVRPDTIAKSLAIGNPADGPYVLDVVRRTGGVVEDVTDEQVVEGIQLLARTEGIFTETAGGTTVANLKKLVGTGALDPEAETVIINSGDGLKTLDAVADRVGPKVTIPPTYDAFVKAGLQ